MKIKIFAIALLLASIVYGQVDTPFDKKHITDSKQLKHALKNIKEGNKLFDLGKGRYIDALGYFLEANKINANNADLNYKIGICYLFTTDIELGLEHLNKAKRLNPQVNHELSYYLGRAYHLNHQFDTAIVYYNEFKLNLYKRELKIRAFEIDKLINECENGKELAKKSEKLLIDNLGPNINTIYPEYAPIIIANEEVMFFTSRRPTTTGGKRDPIDKIYYEDIYMATKDNDNNWQQMPVTELNTNKHDAVVGYFKGKELSYLYTYKNKHGGDIYISLIKNNKIDIPKPLPFPINTKYHESSASLSPDSSTLYFISDRPGGIGGKDIWMSHKEYNQMWSEPINLSDINSPYDEQNVFIHPNGKILFFCSNGHNTIGGFDIFYSIYQDGKWGKPINMGYPINTAADETNYTLSSCGSYAYISSNRQGTIGDIDIFKISYTIKKHVLPSSENELVAWQALFKKLSEKETKNLLTKTENMKDLPSLTNDNLYNEILWSNNIFFEFDSIALSSESRTVLDNLIKLMNDNPDIKIEISGHTDNIGSAAYNQKLSEARAKAVVDYLVEHGIDR
ncbi:MAG: OmpA family protein, partial [Bacteroidales bacterium]